MIILIIVSFHLFRSRFLWRHSLACVYVCTCVHVFNFAMFMFDICLLTRVLVHPFDISFLFAMFVWLLFVRAFSCECFDVLLCQARSSAMLLSHPWFLALRSAAMARSAAPTWRSRPFWLLAALASQALGHSCDWSPRRSAAQVLGALRLSAVLALSRSHPRLLRHSAFLALAYVQRFHPCMH